MKKEFKLLIGVLAIGIGFWALHWFGRPNHVILFAPYRTKGEFQSVLPSGDRRLAKRLADISGGSEGWHLVVISRVGGLKVFVLPEEIQVRTNKPIVVLR